MTNEAKPARATGASNRERVEEIARGVRQRCNCAIGCLCHGLWDDSIESALDDAERRGIAVGIERAAKEMERARMGSWAPQIRALAGTPGAGEKKCPTCFGPVIEGDDETHVICDAIAAPEAPARWVCTTCEDWKSVRWYYRPRLERHGYGPCQPENAATIPCPACIPLAPPPATEPETPPTCDCKNFRHGMCVDCGQVDGMA